MLKVIYGNEPYLIDEEIWKFAEGKNEMSYHRYDDFTSEIWQISKQYPIFEEKNYITVCPETLDDKGLENYLEHMQSYTDILIAPRKVDKRKSIYKKLHKMGVLQEINKVKNSEFQKIVVGMIKENGIEIRESDYNYFVKRCGYFEDDDVTLYNIRTSISQLCMSGEITKDSIDAFVTESNTTKIFALSSAILQQRKRDVFKMAVRFLDEKESPIAMLSVLLRSFRLAYKASLYKDKTHSEIAKMLGVQAFQFEDALEYSPETVTGAMDILQNGIRIIKTGKADSSDAFILTLSKVLSRLK